MWNEDRSLFRRMKAHTGFFNGMLSAGDLHGYLSQAEEMREILRENYLSGYSVKSAWKSSFESLMKAINEYERRKSLRRNL